MVKKYIAIFYIFIFFLGAGAFVDANYFHSEGDGQSTYNNITPHEQKYTVNFDGNEGSPSTQTKEVEEGSSVGDLPSVLRDGHTFIEWNTQQNGEGDVFTSSTIITEDIVVYAQWEINEYTVTFNANEGTPATQTETVEYGSTIDPLPTVTREGHTFLEWNTQENGEGSAFTTETNVIEDVTVYAQWEINVYTVNFYTSEGGEFQKVAMAGVEHGQEMGPLPSVSRDGHTFIEWNKQQDGTGDELTSESIITEDVDVYAQWIRHISSCQELQEMEDNLIKDYVLVNDIDCLDTENWNDGRGFKPIGEEGNSFDGSLDGQGYTISNLYISRNAANHSFNHIGLFGYLGSEATLENINIEDSNITGTGDWAGVGSIVGYLGLGEINNVHIIEGYVYCELDVSTSCGGFAGVANGIIESSSFKGSVISDSGGEIGGLIGANEGTINLSFAIGSVDGGEANRVGGLVGYNGGIIEKSYFEGASEGENRVGGLVGDNRNLVKTSYADATVKGLESIGGLVGLNRGGDIENSHSRGLVEGENRVGGLVGKNGNTNSPGDISKSYSKSEVTGESDVGGFVGYPENLSVNVVNSFWDIQSSQTEISMGGGTGKETNEMKEISTYNNTDTQGLESSWDIMDVNPGETNINFKWNIIDGEKYPFFSWQYAVNFDGNEGSPSSQTKIINPEKEVGSLLSASRDGYNFVEWNTQENGEGDTFTSSTIIIENITVYAKWEEIKQRSSGGGGGGGATRYDIKLIVANNKGGEVKNAGTYRKGEEVTIKAIPESGYYFYGWEEEGLMLSGTREYTFVVEKNREIVGVFRLSGDLGEGIELKRTQERMEELTKQEERVNNMLGLIDNLLIQIEEQNIEELFFLKEEMGDVKNRIKNIEQRIKEKKEQKLEQLSRFKKEKERLLSKKERVVNLKNTIGRILPIIDHDEVIRSSLMEVLESIKKVERRIDQELVFFDNLSL